jgi:flagellar biosynthesis activator protein FlaF
MHSAAQAYGSVARKIASPRDLEADLLLKAAARLQGAMDAWESTTRQQFIDALLYNRKLWTFFLTSVTEPNCQLPQDVRQNIANLGLFIMNHTMAVMDRPAPERLRSLISINREIAAGLRGQG